jgi:hypothetical protein
MTLDDRIAALSDPEAIGLVQRFSRAQPKTDVPSALEASVARQLSGQLDLSESLHSTASQGEVARAALRFIASDPEHQAGIRALLDHSPSQKEKFVIVESAVLVPLVLIALQTHVKFERDKQGTWTVKVEKKPTDANLLKDMVKKLLSLG